MYNFILLILGFVVILIGSFTDFNKREVPDWINYGLILSAICLRAIYSVYYLDYLILISGLIGLGFAFLLASLMFYTGQWGGGDAKLLIGLGAVFGLTFDIKLHSFFMFLINLIIVGSFYGLFWTLYLFVKNWSKSRTEFLSVLTTKKALILKVPLFVLSLIALIASYFIINLRYLLLLFAIILPLMFYVWVYTKVVENVAMLKKIIPLKLTEGDWIVEDIIYNGKKIAGPNDLGISLKQIQTLKQLYAKGKIDTILIKEGIPFVPSFFIAYVVTLLLGNWILMLI